MTPSDRSAIEQRQRTIMAIKKGAKVADFTPAPIPYASWDILALLAAGWRIYADGVAVRYSYRLNVECGIQISVEQREFPSWAVISLVYPHHLVDEKGGEIFLNDRAIHMLGLPLSAQGDLAYVYPSKGEER